MKTSLLKWTLTSFSLVLLALILLPSMAGAANRSSLIVFSANWCASCRDVIPVAQEIANQQGVNFQVVDVDHQQAPGQARQYGLSIPTKQLPQVYYVQNGRTTLLFDGQTYRISQQDLVRSTMLQNLPQD